MALFSASNNLLRSVAYRCGLLLRFQQSRPLCKGPPNDTPNQGSSGEPHSSDSDCDKGNRQKNEGNVGKGLSEEQLTKENASEEQLTKENASEEQLTKENASEEHLTKENASEEQFTKENVAEKETKEMAKKNLSDLLLSLAKTNSVPVAPAARVLLSKPKPKSKKKVKKQKITPSSPAENLNIEPGLVEAAKDVAESLGGDVSATESELLSTLRSHAAEDSINDKPVANLSELFVGMKIERNRLGRPIANQRELPQHDRQDDFGDDPFSERPSDSSFKRRPLVALDKVDLFGMKPLGIFKKKMENAPFEGESLPVWDAAYQRELNLCVTHPPSNAFVEMIRWTEEGKLWTFPIDNEVGLEEEKAIGFHEHVFLEHHLEGWCPKRGPIRHFMELVCVGLSKNPHLTVERKRRHIEWYKNYFEAKKDIMKEVGALEAEQ